MNDPTAVISFHFDFDGNTFELLHSKTFFLGNVPDPTAAAAAYLAEQKNDSPSIFHASIQRPPR